MKKTMSLFLAMAMALALAIPAFAQQNDPSTQTVAVAGKMATPTIQIEAPSDVSLTLNPYQMKYNGEIKALKEKTDQILSVPAVFINKTDGALSAELTATATPASGVTIVDSTAKAEEGKKVFLQIQFGMLKDKTGDGGWDGTEPTKYSFSSNKVEYKAGATGTDPKALSIAATDGKTANYFGFQFSGDAAANPKTAWTANDGIGLSVVINLTPVNTTVVSGG